MLRRSGFTGSLTLACRGPHGACRFLPTQRGKSLAYRGPSREDSTQPCSILPRPIDPTGPGSKDITSSIDFAQARRWAEEAGLCEAWSMSQEAFLLGHGALEALNDIPRDTVEGASSYLRLRQMMIPHAGGMGDAFRVALYEKGMG